MGPNLDGDRIADENVPYHSHKDSSVINKAFAFDTMSGCQGNNLFIADGHLAGSNICGLQIAQSRQC